MARARVNVATMTKYEIALYWFIGVFSALFVVTAKLGLMLFGIADAPPDDPVQAASWRRKRRWLAISEFSALPAFATVAVTATIYWHWPPVTSVLIAMGLGGVGFGFLLNALVFFARKKVGMETQ